MISHCESVYNNRNMEATIEELLNKLLYIHLIEYVATIKNDSNKVLL